MLFGCIWKLSFPDVLLRLRWIVFRGSLSTKTGQPEEVVWRLNPDQHWGNSSGREVIRIALCVCQQTLGCVLGHSDARSSCRLPGDQGVYSPG